MAIAFNVLGHEFETLDEPCFLTTGTQKVFNRVKRTWHTFDALQERMTDLLASTLPNGDPGTHPNGTDQWSVNEFGVPSDEWIAENMPHQSFAVGFGPGVSPNPPIPGVSDTPPDEVAGAVMRWRGIWAEGEAYAPGAVVRDGAYIMTAVRDTTDYAAPQPVGEAAFVYQGASPTGEITAKSLLCSNTYDFPQVLQVLKVRVYTIVDNTYSVWFRRPQLGDKFEPLLSFVAVATGWQEIPTNNAVGQVDAILEVGVIIVEPDPTPTTFTLSYDYETPNNAAVPTVGIISHANRTPSELRVSKTDQNGDQSAQLATLSVGDVIEGAGVRWVIQLITDNGTWINFAVTPASQGSPVGVQDFVFETVTATPITTVIDPDYYLTNENVTGQYKVDGEDPVVTDNALGIDIEVQELSVSPDWDYVGGGM